VAHQNLKVEKLDLNSTYSSPKEDTGRARRVVQVSILLKLEIPLTDSLSGSLIVPVVVQKLRVHKEHSLAAACQAELIVPVGVRSEEAAQVHVRSLVHDAVPDRVQRHESGTCVEMVGQVSGRLPTGEEGLHSLSSVWMVLMTSA
jgi:hypothetical protein